MNGNVLNNSFIDRYYRTVYRNDFYPSKREGKWVFVGDIEQYFSNIIITKEEYEQYLKDHPEFRLQEIEARKPVSIEIIEKYAIEESDKDDKALTRNKAFEGIFNKGNKRWA